MKPLPRGDLLALINTIYRYDSAGTVSDTDLGFPFRPQAHLLGAGFDVISPLRIAGSRIARARPARTDNRSMDIAFVPICEEPFFIMPLKGAGVGASAQVPSRHGGRCCPITPVIGQHVMGGLHSRGHDRPVPPPVSPGGEGQLHRLAGLRLVKLALVSLLVQARHLGQQVGPPALPGAHPPADSDRTIQVTQDLARILVTGQPLYRHRPPGVTISWPAHLVTSTGIIALS
jgi:hypothetical protein